ncbi:orexin/Hypocretin receptor type 1-like [Cylas formicarius]|uniref:orexin/Hypocretin receptor type 1-like n=1 Tax=Cylas formicarius TaxID=197179 RepID=UPI0029587B92|nr:orexin/Hypocretin receptor type 1-like [Cylas formicarius]XP_060522187.1 orexin/Hypocretin receptor type 1-like [Cylas formicarius]
MNWMDTITLLSFCLLSLEGVSSQNASTFEAASCSCSTEKPYRIEQTNSDALSAISRNTKHKRQVTEESYDYDDKEMGNFSRNDSDSFDPMTIEDIKEYIFPKSWTWVLILLHSVVFAIGLLGNVLVCVAVYRNHSMRTVTNYFIVNLAVADALVILFCLPFSVVWDVTSTWWFGTAMCKFVLYVQNVSVTVSILTLAFISVDRWYAICFPLKFKSTTGRAKTAICVIWIIALVTEIPEPIYLTAIPYSNSYIYFTQCTVTWSNETDTAFMIVKMIFFYVLPLSLMSLAYMQIIRVLWRSGNAPHQAMNSHTGSVRSGQGGGNMFAMNMNTSTEGQLRSRRKAAKMLVAVVVMFAFCFLPVHLLSVLRLTIKLSNSDMNRAFSLLSHWLCYANSAINPIIYNFMSGKFRQEFKSAFFKCGQIDRSELNFTRTSTYIYRYTTTTHRHSNRSKTETIPLSTIK